MPSLAQSEIEEIAAMLHSQSLALDKRADAMLDVPTIATGDRLTVYASLTALAKRIRLYANYLDLWVQQDPADDEEGSRF